MANAFTLLDGGSTVEHRRSGQSENGHPVPFSTYRGTPAISLSTEMHQWLVPGSGKLALNVRV